MVDNVLSNLDSDDLRQYPEEFINLLLSNHSRIFAYILTLVPNYADAEDIMQEVSGIMWRKFSEFRSGSSFASWGTRIAHYLVLDYRRKQNRKVVKYYDDAVFQQIAPLAAEASLKIDSRVEALSNCMNKMTERDRTLLRSRYFEGLKPMNIASRIGMSVQTVYKSLARAQGRLAMCVKRSVQSGDAL